MSAETVARMEAAFAMEYANSDTLRTLVAQHGRKEVSIIWSLGYLAGEMGAYENAISLRQNSEQ